MTDKEKEKLELIIESEGFDYAIHYYSDFKEIKDKEFHKLKKELEEARENLIKYIGIEE